ncbi:MAG: VWA domain-containing protein [Rubrivivax sp.]|nr:VWA domain-containing protein [Rubrivivax sp.]
MFKRITAALAATAALLGLGSAAHAAPVISTDIIMIVDESGSMGTVQANLRNNIGLFASILAAGGIDARFGLVGYGSGAQANAPGPRRVTDLTTAAGFAAAAQGLVASGGTEPGYASIAFAMNELDNQNPLFSFRPNAVMNIILFTDEPSNGDGSSAAGRVGGAVVTEAIVDGLLTDNQALFNAVLSGSSTINSFGDLATDHSGQVFNLNSLNTADQSVVQAFVTTFAEAKLQETIDFCTANPTAPQCQGGAVPLPGTLLLAGLGLFALTPMRRRVTLSAA